ncbi:outer membrane beta-barrel protein, partial [candidate division KSB1 bacterium]
IYLFYILNEKIKLIAMKKIKTYIFILTITLITSSLYSQGTYFNINGGYGFKKSSQNIDYYEFYNYTVGTNSTTREQIKVSLGKGINVGGTLGHMFTENIGAELGISYLFGGKSKAEDQWVGGKADYTLKSKMLRFNPSIVIASGRDGINPYAKFGLIIGTGSILYKYEENSGGNVLKYKQKLKGGLALGCTAGLGAIYSLSDLMSFFAEINMVNLSYAPKKGEITEATNNGTDLLPTATTKEKEVEFVDEYTTDNNTPLPDSQPDKHLKTRFPFGSIGINVGLIIKLSKSKEETVPQ